MIGSVLPLVLDAEQAMHLAEFRSAREYVGFDDAAAAVLVRFEPLVRPALDDIVRDFYATIQAQPRSRAVLFGGSDQVERLARTLRIWLVEGLSGPHGQSFLESRQRIGRAHVEIRLPQELMFTAMNRVRTALRRVAFARLSGDELERTSSALDQWLDLELAIMLDSYREYWEARVRAGERLATIGQFAAAIGHELRNPLSVADSSLSLIEARVEQLGYDDAVLQKHHGRVRQQIRHCHSTLETLLELARENPPKRVTGPLRPAIEASLETLAIPEGVHVDLTVDPALCVDADPLQLRDVFANVIHNALEAVASGGRVEIRAARSEQGVDVWVEDDGPGVPEAIRHRLFDLWFSTRGTGTGLGLALARKIVELHSGSLTLEPSGRGASFRIWLPLGVSPPSS